MGIFEKFKSGFKKSASAFTSGLRDIVVKKEIDDKTLDRIEDYLIQSDVGVASASEIREIISKTKIDPKAQTKKMGRNEPCFCGSGKKFKHCHGAL